MEIGATFSIKQDLKNILVMLNSATGYNIATPKSEKIVYTVTLKTLADDHQCTPAKQSRSTFGFKETIFIWKIKIMDTPSYPSGEMARDLKRDHNMDVEYHVYYRAKQAILNSLNGELRENYSLLKRFLTVFEEKNQGSFVRVQGTEGVFLREFAATAVCVSAFKYLRPLASVDGVHMHSQAKGVLFFAAGADAIGQVVHLCCALVDVECFDNWDWFFCCFKEAFGTTVMVSRDLTLLSDRLKELIKAAAERFPLSAHGMCVNHLKENLKKKVNKQSLNQKVFELAKAKTDLQYETIMEQIRSISVIARTYLSEVDKSHFVDAFFSGKRFGQYMLSISESLNSVILPERGEFVFQAPQGIIRKFVEAFQQRNDKYAMRSTVLPPEITKMVQWLLSTSRSNYQAHQTAPLAFELSLPSDIYVVDPETKHVHVSPLPGQLVPVCSCRDSNPLARASNGGYNCTMLLHNKPATSVQRRHDHGVD